MPHSRDKCLCRTVGRDNCLSDYHGCNCPSLKKIIKCKMTLEEAQKMRRECRPYLSGYHLCTCFIDPDGYRGCKLHDFRGSKKDRCICKVLPKLQIIDPNYECHAKDHKCLHETRLHNRCRSVAHRYITGSKHHYCKGDWCKHKLSIKCDCGRIIGVDNTYSYARRYQVEYKCPNCHYYHKCPNAFTTPTDTISCDNCIGVYVVYASNTKSRKIR